MFVKLMKRLMDEAPADGGQGGAAPAAAPAASPAAAAPAAAAPDAGAALNPLQAAAAAFAPVTIPEKFTVKNEDGSVNHEATALKLAEGYSAAEKRIGSGEAPPKSAAEYQISVPKSLEGAWNPAEDAQLQSFTEKAHALGFNQKQIDLVIEQYGELAPGLVGGMTALSAEECTAALKEAWTTPEQYKEETNAAARALRAYGGDQVEPFLQKYGNDPDFIKMMAKIGHEVSEDTSPDPGEILQGETIEQLEASEAYRNASDPKHAAVSAKVRAFYEAKAKKQQADGSVPLI